MKYDIKSKVEERILSFLGGSCDSGTDSYLIFSAYTKNDQLAQDYRSPRPRSTS